MSCTTDSPPLLIGTGELMVDGVDVGNVAIIDTAGEGENQCIFYPAVQAESDTSQAQLGFQQRIVIEATCDWVTIENLEFLLKEPSANISGGYQIPFTTIRQEALHQVVFMHHIATCDDPDACTMVIVLLRRAFIELPWTLPFRRDSFTEFVLRFIALPDAEFPTSPFGYMQQLCPGVTS
jgi:hypothetical protein